VALDNDVPDHQRMEFRLEIEENWPPVSTETLWVESVGAGSYKIDNAPFFVKNIAVGDIVDGERTNGELLSFERKTASGGHSTIWVIALEDEIRQPLRDSIYSMNCSFESGPWPSLISIDVPDARYLDALHHYLDDLTSQGLISFVDGCIAR
jgi:hypothetical protein